MKTSRRNSGRPVLNQSKEVLCIFVSFQESRDPKKSQKRMSMTCFYHIGADFKAA